MECNGCTACCTVLPIEAINKPMYTPCQFCDKGCTIYDKKPQTCNEFECAYFQGLNVSESLRPDKCGVIFYKRTPRVFSGAVIPDCTITDSAKGQIAAFNSQGFSVVLLKGGRKPHIMLADGHNAEDIMAEYIEALDGYLQH